MRKEFSIEMKVVTSFIRSNALRVTHHAYTLLSLCGFYNSIIVALISRINGVDNNLVLLPVNIFQKSIAVNKDFFKTYLIQPDGLANQASVKSIEQAFPTTVTAKMNRLSTKAFRLYNFRQ